MMDWTHYAPYFRKEEFDCKCGCGLNNIDEVLMERIFDMRKETGIGFSIASGARCPAHNKASGGAESSDHLTGHGVDVKCTDSRSRWMIVEAAVKKGINRIGIGRTFIHLGMAGPNSERMIWLYGL